MKVLKPDNLALLYRAFSFAGRNMLSLGAMALFHFERGNRDELLPEAQLWGLTAQALGDKTPLDEGWPKQAAEFLVYGAACAPQGTEVRQLSVNVTVAGAAKQLYVFGDREFGFGGLLSPPRPFSRMAIVPENAFGGAGFADNPVGKGFADVKRADGSSSRPAPNIEHPRQMMAAVGDTPRPAGFGALPPDNSERRRHLGKFDDRWLGQSWPQLPDDTHLEHFQAAPPDQRLPRFPDGGESFELENMHPQKPRLSGRLPGLRARCFVNRKLAGGEEQFSEIEARAETVWLFPELECGIVLYRASVQIGDSDGDDVLHVMAEWENLSDAPLPFAHYEALFRQQTEAVQQVAVAAADAVAAPEPASVTMPLAAAIPAVAAPAAAAVPLDPEILALEKLTGELQAQTSALLRRHGLTEADIIRPPTEAPEITLEELETLTAKIDAETKALQRQYGLTAADIKPPPAEAPEITLEQLEAETAKAQAQREALLKKHGVTDADIQRYLAQQPGQEHLAEFMAQAPAGLAQQTAELEALQRQAATLLALPAVTAMPLPAAEPEMPAASPTPKPSREQVVERHQRGDNFAGLDLSELDLSELDLSGADFSDALLSDTGFQKSRLAGARFDRALLQGADFSDADLSAARLAAVSGGQAVFARARMEGSDLSLADFSGGDFSGVRLGGANLAEAVFDGANLAGLKAAGCQAERASFNDCAMAQADLGGARLAGARFNGARCEQANLAGSVCDDAEFYEADLSGADFRESSLRASRAGKGSRFDRATFADARLDRANWEGATIDGAGFERTVLDHADFSRVQARGARFNRALAKGAKFAKADLGGADLTAINLFKGSLRKARVEGAVLQFANLYGVDFEGTLPDAGSTEGSNIDRTRLLVGAKGKA